MFINYLFTFEFWWLDQFLIPDMWQLVLANISIKGWVIDSNQHGFPDGPGHALVLPAHYAEIVQGYFMASDGEVVMYRWWSSHVFSEFITKCSAWLLYIFIFTVYPSTLVSINHSTFLQYVISVLGVHYEFFDCIASFEIHLYAMLAADNFAALTQSFHTGHHNVGFFLIFIRVCVDVILSSPGVLLDSDDCPFQSPCWVLAIIQCFIWVVFFLLQQLLIGTDCPSPVF